MTTRPTILCLSYYYSTDRILIYTNFLRKLAEFAEPRVWSLSVNEKNFPAENPNGKYFEPLKEADSIPQWINLIRHFSDYVWDHKGLSFSRASMWRLIKQGSVGKIEKVLWNGAKIASKVNRKANFDKVVERLMLGYGYCEDSQNDFETNRPDAVIAMVPFTPLQMSIVASARKAGIPTIAYITSWDNITTKTRLSFDHDAYLVWSEAMKSELIEFHPQARKKPIHIVGAPQYDILLDTSFHLDKEEFFELQGWDPTKKTVLYCLGSPNFLKEDYGVESLLALMDQDLRNDVQVVARLHPGFYEADYKIIQQIPDLYPDVVIQGNKKYFDKHPIQPFDSILEWVNTFRHVDVVVNLASTVTVDAAIFDKPVININYDSEPGAPNGQLVKEINRNWNHFAPVANSGGVWNVDSPDELVQALKSYLSDPTIHAAGRRKIIEHVCGKLDGKAGEKMAGAVRDIMSRLAKLRTDNGHATVRDADSKATFHRRAMVDQNDGEVV